MPDSKYLRAVVTTRRELTPELWIVRIQPEEPLNFEAGQYVTIGLPGAERMVERPYSVVSAPHEPELEFFLELVPEGQLTPQLYDVPVGGEVHLRRAAKGRLLFDEASGRPNHLMVATVTGVAPYISMVRRFVSDARQNLPVRYRIAVLEAASTSSELGYDDELAEYAAGHDWFRYIPTVSRIWLDAAWTGERGRAEDIIRKYIDAMQWTGADTTAYLCGNPVMVDNVRGVLIRAGFSKESIKEELFWVQGHS